MTGRLDATRSRVDEVTEQLRNHAGGIELVELTDDGVVRLRFTGMCTGCLNKPLTTAWTVRPALLDLPWVTAVQIEGSRISAEAEERLAAAYEASIRRRAARASVHGRRPTGT